MASMIVVSGKSRGFYLALREGTLTIGRDEASDMQVLDEMVSRQHMQIRYDKPAGTYKVADLNSANGVFINGQRITGEMEIADGDTILIGESKLFYSTKDFLDGDSALMHFKQRGERGKSTLIQ